MGNGQENRDMNASNKILYISRNNHNSCSKHEIPFKTSRGHSKCEKSNEE